MTLEIRVTPHGDVTGDDLDRLRVLFDGEYLEDHGPWSPDAPYGYAGADVHVTAVDDGMLLGHAGFEVRLISVGNEEVTVGGVGGVLVTPEARGSGLGRRLMSATRDAMRENRGVEFGYLGCRPSVVAFYESAGWLCIHARERHRSRVDDSTVVDDDGPVLICTARRQREEWPAGDIDLRGRPW